MVLIKSLSGIRGTLYSSTSKIANLTINSKDHILQPKQISSLTYEAIKPIILSFVDSIIKPEGYLKIIIGADGRTSGTIVINWIMDILSNYSEIEIEQIGITTTPTLAFTVKDSNASGGIMVTASHNPQEWNGIKLFNAFGEGLSPQEWSAVYKKSEKNENQAPASVSASLTMHHKLDKNRGITYKKLSVDTYYIKNHIKKILNLDIIDVDSIRSKKWKIAVDGVNCGSGEALKTLLSYLGVEQIYSKHKIGEKFGRGAEPIENNLLEFSNFLKEKECFIGLATDPDGDRLSILDEKGGFWGEEYTLIACTDYVLKQKKGNIVSNLSSSIILKTIQEATFIVGNESYDCCYCPVGESNVVKKMKEVNAIIGGEGNGGVIYPELNYCRDALVATAIILSYLAKYNLTPSQLRAKYPSSYFIKEKINLTTISQSTLGYPNIDMSNILIKYLEINANNIISVNKEDGIRVDFKNLWIHIRISNTEPIIRICGEGRTKEEISTHVNQIIDCISSSIKTNVTNILL